MMENYLGVTVWVKDPNNTTPAKEPNVIAFMEELYCSELGRSRYYNTVTLNLSVEVSKIISMLKLKALQHNVVITIEECTCLTDLYNVV